MIRGSLVLLRPVRDQDWPFIESWSHDREALWGAFQRHQLDHVPLLRQAYQHSELLRREGGLLIVQTLDAGKAVGFVRYSFIAYPDADFPCPDIGFGIPDVEARGKGYAREAVGLLTDYLFSGYASERIVAFTDVDNSPAQRVMEGVGFQREGILRRAMFRDGRWHDIAIYGILRHERESASTGS
ncbi:MAG: GNAT family N-acetyltransferase [Dehalococcoidia bacterium]